MYKSTCLVVTVVPILLIFLSNPPPYITDITELDRAAGGNQCGGSGETIRGLQVLKYKRVMDVLQVYIIIGLK